MAGAIRVGTSGYAYRWPDFYPPGLVKGTHLAFYASRFSTVEVNYSFHRVPRPATYRRWAAETPPDFTFTLKASREVTHVRRLAGVEEPWSEFLTNARALGGKLGAILVQLPPALRAQPERLDRFLRLTALVAEEIGLVPPRVALEARHPTWLANAEVTEVLKRHGAALAFAHSSRFPYPDGEPITADFVYLRFHGPRQWSASLYGAGGLAPWVARIRRWRRAGLDVFAYFNNDVNGYAPLDARVLAERAGP